MDQSSKSCQLATYYSVYLAYKQRIDIIMAWTTIYQILCQVPKVDEGNTYYPPSVSCLLIVEHWLLLWRSHFQVPLGAWTLTMPSKPTKVAYSITAWTISVRTCIFVHNVNKRARDALLWLIVAFLHDRLLRTAFNDTALTTLLLRSMRDALVVLHSNWGTFIFLAYLSWWAMTTTCAL